MSGRSSVSGEFAHVAFGVGLVGLGAAGVVHFWGAFGGVMRGAISVSLLGGGLVMLGAGLQQRRKDPETASIGENAFRVLAAVGLLLLIGAAVGGWDFEPIGEWSVTRVGGYLVLGLVSGVVGGMLGLGGGVVHLSGMTLLFGFPFAFARGATLINNVFINAAAAVHYRNRRLLNWQVIAVLLPAALVGVVAGSWLQTSFDEELMRKTFAVFVILITAAVVLDTLASGRREQREGDPPSVPVRHGFVGLIAGVLSGILGISGGIVAVPGQTLLGAVPLRNAIANSTITTSSSSAIGALLLLMPGAGSGLGAGEMVTIAVLFVPGNLIGGHLGARWMGKLPVVTVRIFFLVVLVAIALRSWGIFG